MTSWQPTALAPLDGDLHMTQNHGNIRFHILLHSLLPVAKNRIRKNRPSLHSFTSWIAPEVSSGHMPRLKDSRTSQHSPTALRLASVTKEQSEMSR